MQKIFKPATTGSRHQFNANPGKTTWQGRTNEIGRGDFLENEKHPSLCNRIRPNYYIVFRSIANSENTGA
jgi:hypothetical protein